MHNHTPLGTTIPTYYFYFVNPKVALSTFHVLLAIYMYMYIYMSYVYGCCSCRVLFVCVVTSSRVELLLFSLYTRDVSVALWVTLYT